MEKDKTNLVYTETRLKDGHVVHPAMKPLRHIAGENPDHIVNGVGYNKEYFNHYFKFWYDKVIADWLFLGFINEDKTPLSKSAFIEALGIHQYGSGQNKDFVAYIGRSGSAMYQMQSEFRETNKKVFLKNLYQTYLDIIEGDMQPFDGGIMATFRFGNAGVPLTQTPIKYANYDNTVTKEFID